MLEINLLMWREEKRQRHKKIINVSLAVLIFVLCVLYGFLHEHMRVQLLQQAKKREELNNQIRQKKIRAHQFHNLQHQYINLVATEQFINQVHTTEKFFIDVFIEMLNQMPPEIKITYLERKKNHYLMLGQTPSTLVMAEWLKHFPQAQLIGIKQISSSILNFKIVIY